MSSTFKQGDAVRVRPSAITTQQRKRFAELSKLDNSGRISEAEFDEWLVLKDLIEREARISRALGSGTLTVLDIMPVAPGDQRLAGHTQRVLLRLPSGRQEWFSGAWVVPA